jgi:hypothetical protein
LDSIGTRRVCDETKRKQCNGNSFHDQMLPSMYPALPSCWRELFRVFANREMRFLDKRHGAQDGDRTPNSQRGKSAETEDDR